MIRVTTHNITTVSMITNAKIEYSSHLFTIKLSEQQSSGICEHSGSWLALGTGPVARLTTVLASL